MNDGPLIVQSDKTLLLEVDHPNAEAARRAIAPFAELERAPEHVHTYRITPLGLWNARAAGHDAEQVVDALMTHSRYAVPHALLVDVADTMDRYGRLTLEKEGLADSAEGTRLVLRTTDRPVARGGPEAQKIRPLIGERIDGLAVVVHPSERGTLKQELLKVGWPAEDLAGYVDGEAHPIELDQADWHLRPYQQQAVDGFWHGGSGVVVLPCGAGKTLVGVGAMARGQGDDAHPRHQHGRARGSGRTSCSKRTTLTEDEIGEYSGDRKEIRPVTIATYQVLTTRRKGAYTHLDLLDARDWGLIIYDEVHLLPAPVFRMTADLQARRRLGLTATLVREDGREEDVFSLIGPKRFDVPWKDLEAQGYIAAADCVEVRVTLPEQRAPRVCRERARGALPPRRRAPTRSCRSSRSWLERHTGEPTLVIGQYLDQLHGSPSASAPTSSPARRRCASAQRLYAAFRTGEITTLVVSKVANFSIDLPEASVAIQMQRHLRLAPGGGAAARTRPAAQGRRAHRALLHDRVARHGRRRLRRAPPALPHRAGLRLSDRRRRRPLTGRCGSRPPCDAIGR